MSVTMSFPQMVEALERKYGSLNAASRKADIPTTTLHHILARHPRLFFPKGEVHFFDIDNVLQHGDFNHYHPGHWLWQDMERDPRRMWAWYGARFKDARPDQLLGEDSTTYMASPLAIRRIAAQRKPVRLVLLLREPVARTWSQYWHLLRSGRITRTFEETLRREPSAILERSMYLDQIRMILGHIPRDRVHVLLFEDLVADPSPQVSKVLSAIGLDPRALPSDATTMHSNAGTRPKYPGMQRWRNRWAGRAYDQRYMQRLPFPPNNARGPSLFDRLPPAPSYSAISSAALLVWTNCWTCRS